MGGRGNNRNSSKNYYNSRNSRGRDASYDHSYRPQNLFGSFGSQPPQSTNNYPTGRGNSNFQSNPPFWQNSFTRGSGFPRQPPAWSQQNLNHTPNFGGTNYRPLRPASRDQQPRFPNPQRPWNNGLSQPTVPPPPPPLPPFSCSQMPITIPMPPHLFGGPCTPKETSTSTSCATNPPLGSKEDRELRLEVAKTLLKKSLEESKDEENSKSTPLSLSSATTASVGQQKKKTSKPRPAKPNEANNKQSVCELDQVSDNIISKSISADPVAEEQRKRRVSLESNYVVTADVCKPTTKPTTPKRNRSNSFSSSGIPKTPEISTPSQAQNIKQRIIHQLLGMSKITLKEIISNPRSRKFEFVMKYMMKESRWKQSQIQRQAAQAGIDSTTDSSSCELVQRDYEDLLSDPDLAINLSNLPPEMIETLGNIFNLGPVSSAKNEASDDSFDLDDISCLFDSNSPSNIKMVPLADLSSPVKGPSKISNVDIEGQSETSLVNVPCPSVKSEELIFDSSIPEDTDHDINVNLILNTTMSIPESIGNEEPSKKLALSETCPSPDSYMNTSTCFLPVADFPMNDSKEAASEEIPIESAEDTVLCLPRPEIDDFSLSIDQERTRETVTNVSDKPEDYNLHAVQEMFQSPVLSSDVRNDEDKDEEMQGQSAEKEVPLNDEDPMFSTQSNSPMLDEDLDSCGLEARKDVQNNADIEDVFNNPLSMDGPLMSPDSFNNVNVSNNEMMILKSINTVEPNEPLNFFENAENEKETDEHYLPSADDSGNVAFELSSKSQDNIIEGPSDTSSEINSCSTSKAFVENETLACEIETIASKNETLACEIETIASKNETLASANGCTQSCLLKTDDGLKVTEPKETNAFRAHTESSAEHRDLAKIKTEIEDSAFKEQESSTILPNYLHAVEIGIQTDPLENDPVFIARDEMDSILKLLESSTLPGIDRVKQLLQYSSNKLLVQLQENENSPTIMDNVGKSAHHIKKKIVPTNSRSLNCPISVPLLVQDRPNSPSITDRATKVGRNLEESILPTAAIGIACPSSELSSVEIERNNPLITSKPSMSRHRTEGNLVSKYPRRTDCLATPSSVQVQEIPPITAKPSRSRHHIEEKLPPKSVKSFDCSTSASPVKENSSLITARRSNSSGHHNEDKLVPIAAADLDLTTSAAAILKSLQAQIKGLEPKDKLKYVFLKITDIEKKIATWADIKKELYQQVSYILEDEKSQSASSSQEENVASEVETETSKDLTKSSSETNSSSCPQSSQKRSSRSGVSKTHVDLQQSPGSNSKRGSNSTATSTPKILSQEKRKRPLSHGRKMKKNKKEKTSVNIPSVPGPESLAVQNKFATPERETSQPKRTSARIKLESESDISEDNIICTTERGRSRSSKRFKADNSVSSTISKSSAATDTTENQKRSSTRKSASVQNPLPTPSPVSSPLRKTKAELKQMVFFPKTTEKRTRRSSVSQPLTEDAELHVSKVQKIKETVVVKEECMEEVAEPQPCKPASEASSPVVLRNCSVVLRQLDESAFERILSSQGEVAMETHSVSCSSDEEDELPLIVLSRKKIVESPSSSQEDIDVSSVSSSDTASLKLQIACPKSMKSRMAKSEGSSAEDQHLPHHSSKHAPLTFSQHQKGAILDIKVVGKHVLAASEEGIVFSYSVKSGKLKKRYRGHSAAVTCICIINSELEPFYPEKMVTGSIDSQVRCFILKTGEQVHAPLQVGETSAIDANWGVIYFGTKQGEVVQVNAKTFTKIGDIFECSREAVLALKATKEGPRKVLVIGSRNQAITVRDAETGLLLRSVSGDCQCTVYSLLLDNSLVYCGTKEGVVPVFDFTCGQEMFRLQAGNGVRCLKSYNGLLFAGCYDGFIYVFKGQTLVTKFAGGKMIISMDFTKNKVIFSSKDQLQALNYPPEVSLLLKESRTRKVK